MKNIKIRLKSYLKELNNNNITIIETKGIKNNNKINYKHDNISHKLLIEDNKITLIRENNEFKNILEFIQNKNTQSYYLLKENNFAIDINIKTKNIKYNDNEIIIKYEVLDSNESFEYKIEMRKI